MVETDTWEYLIGDDVIVTLTLTSGSDTSIAADVDLAVYVARLDSPLLTPVLTQTRSVNLPAHGEVRETYELTVSQYQDSGLFIIEASAEEALVSEELTQLNAQR